MTAKPMKRRTKAATIVPIALVSGLWTASLFNGGGVATASSPTGGGRLPDGTSVPTKAIEAPASVPIPGVVAPAVPQGSADSVVSGASTNGIPAPALAGYQRAAQIIDSADKTCNIPWELIAAIGRVESDHGRYGGNTLSDKGVSKPGIFGPELNGKGGTQAIADTDAGQLDHDTVFDRAVGPMQFIPSTWQVVKVDADGDGVRDPQNINDASLATAVYLCSGNENLGQRKGQESAVFRYNHSRDYVNLVLRIMEAYSQGDYTAVASGSQGGTTFSPSYSSAISQRRQAAGQRAKAAGQKNASGPRTSASSSSSGSSTSATPATPAPTPGGAGDANTASDPGKTVKKTADKAKKGVADTVKGATQTLTQAQASVQCLTQVGATNLSQLNLLGALKVNQYNSCLGQLGF